VIVAEAKSKTPPCMGKDRNNFTPTLLHQVKT